MKKAIVLFFIMILSAGVVLAQENNNSERFWIEEVAGCYEYSINTKANNLQVRTKHQLTLEKDLARGHKFWYTTLTDIDKHGSERGKSLYIKLNKLSDVRNIVMSPREFLVSFTPYPRDSLEINLPAVHDIIQAVLCEVGSLSDIPSAFKGEK